MTPLRVAAYCRVSTEQEDQQNSLRNQKAFFRQYIEAQENWCFAGLYADAGISGTTTRDRRAFCAMLAAAERGDLDLIITKEVSRFARNTVDALAHTRRLRELGVGVWFLSDNIDTRAGDGEFRLTIMASVAQEESRKISERVRWGQRRSMERGVVFGSVSPYGYHLQNGLLTVCAEQAETVRLVYRLFLEEQLGIGRIARELSARDIPPPRANTAAWSHAMVRRLLTGEKYCGDLTQGKTCTENYLTHKKSRRINGTITLHDHHEAIVSREQYRQAQQRLAVGRRAPCAPLDTAARHWAAGRVLCGDCGSPFYLRRTVRPNGAIYAIWVCGTKIRKGSNSNRGGCAMRGLNDRVLKVALRESLRRLTPNGLADQLADEIAALQRDRRRTVQAALPPVTAETIQTLLEESDAVYKAVLCRAVVTVDTLRLTLRGAPEQIEVRFHAAGRGKNYHLAVTCWMKTPTPTVGQS